MAMPGGMESSDDEFDELYLPKDHCKDKRAPKKSTKTTLHDGSLQKMKTNPIPIKLTVHMEDLKSGSITGNLEKVKFALCKGANVNHVYRGGWTALMYAAHGNHIAIMQHLFENGADVNHVSDGQMVQMAALSSSKCTVETIEVLYKAGAQLNVKDNYETTPLMVAARNGNVDIMKYLIENNVNLNEQDTRGYSALVWAACRGRLAAVKYLVEAGIDKELRTTKQKKAFDIAADNIQEDNSSACDYIAVCKFLKPDFQRSIPEISPASSNIDQNRLPQTQSQQNQSSQAQSSQTQSQTESGDVNSGEVVESVGCKSFVYGELEMFLSGVQLSELISMFHEQEISFWQLQLLTDEDLVKMGISKMGNRLTILQAIRDMHKKHWSSSSIGKVLHSKYMTCPEMVALLGNISRHVQLLTDNLFYVRSQLAAEPQILATGQAGATAIELSEFTDITINNMQALNLETNRLQARLFKLLSRDDYRPVGLIGPPPSRKGWKVARFGARCAAAALLVAAATHVARGRPLAAVAMGVVCGKIIYF